MNPRRIASRAFALALALGAAALVAEVGLRIARPKVVEAFVSRRPLGSRSFTVDEELGYRPLPGGPEYGPEGVAWNDYSVEKHAGKTRLLFLGDSVTIRGKIIAGFRSLLGDDFEYWNAGVTGYSTAQEVGYYDRIHDAVRADRVILTFHLNDFEGPPVAFQDGEKVMRLYTRDSTLSLNPWLLRYSRIYCWWVASSTKESASGGDGIAQVGDSIERSLAELRDEVSRDGATLSVLVLPWLRPYGKWQARIRARREWILATLDRLGIEHYDFLPTLEQALADEVDVMEAPHDPQHPSDEFGLLMAKDLIAKGFEGSLRGIDSP